MAWQVYELQQRTIYNLHAVEDFLLEKVREESISAVMFSQLSNPGISIATAQHLLKDVHVERARAQNVDITRRRTGGRSVYFDDSYYILSVAYPQTASKNPKKEYEKTCGAIAETLVDILGKPVDLQNRNDFIIQGGKKIGGAAQREEQAILIHCYLRYNKDLNGMLDLLKIDGHELRPYQQTVHQLVDALNSHTTSDFRTTYHALRDGLVKHLCRGDAQPKQFTDQEKGRIRQIEQQYHDEEWIQGTGKEHSRGHCDIIADKTLLIPELVSKVTFK
jgi:lipoate-protein ligase A